jgi:hypothetical protein
MDAIRGLDYARSRCIGAGSSKRGANLFVSNRKDGGGGVVSHDRSSLHRPLARNKRTGYGIDSVSHTATFFGGVDTIRWTQTADCYYYRTDWSVEAVV